MTNFFLLLRRELGAYFSSAMAYVIFTVFLLAVGWYFVWTLDGFAESRVPITFQFVMAWIIGLIILISPLLTMRLIAEEKNQGTLETLMTAPISDHQFVLAKYFSAVFFIHFLLFIPIIGYAMILSFQASLDVGAIFTAYVGAILAAGTVLAIGILVSAMCRNQITAGVVTLIISLVLLLMAYAAGRVTQGSVLQAVLLRLDLIGGTQAFMRGLIDTRDVVFYLSVIIFFLFLTVRVVDSRRWR